LLKVSKAVEAWRLAAGIVKKSCPAEGEVVVYVGFTGTAHILADLGHFIVEECQQHPQTIGELAEKVNARFEADDGVDLGGAVQNTVRQLRDLGILTPCMPTP
jgi:PqqD family protein of HPr-rel-A system